LHYFSGHAIYANDNRSQLKSRAVAMAKIRGSRMNGQVSRWIAATAVAAAVLAVAGEDARAQGGGLSNQQLLQLIQDQQRQIEELKAMVKTSQRAKAAPPAGGAPEENSALAKVLESIDVGGIVEVEATNTGDFAGADTSDIALAKVEVFLDTMPTDYLMTHVQLIYEDDGDDIVRLDEAWARLGNPETFPLYLQGGKYAVPFGNFDTDMSTDNLIQTLVETKEANVLLGAAWQSVALEGYLYNGDTQRSGDGDHIDQFGVALRYGEDFENGAFGLGAGYIRNLADSDGITDALGGAAVMLDSYVGGAAFDGVVSYMDVTLRGGYAMALDDFRMSELPFGAGGARPSAWVTEASYAADILDRETVFAVTVQGTDEALALGLPELRIGGAVTVEVMEHAAVTAEYLHDSDYGVADGGTGKNGHTATLKLAVDF
jgi:hypothetical protein